MPAGSAFSGSRVFPAFSRMVPHGHMLEVMGVPDAFHTSLCISQPRFVCWALLLFVVAAHFTRLMEVIWLPEVITEGMKIPSLQICGLSLGVHF